MHMLYKWNIQQMEVVCILFLNMKKSLQLTLIACDYGYFFVAWVNVTHSEHLYNLSSFPHNLFPQECLLHIDTL